MPDVMKTKCIKWQKNLFMLLAYMVRRDTPKPIRSRRLRRLRQVASSGRRAENPPVLTAGECQNKETKTHECMIETIVQ